MNDAEANRRHALAAQAQDRPMTTRSVRMHLDIEFNIPQDGADLWFTGRQVAEATAEFLDVHSAKVTQIIPAEGERFDWQGATSGT